MVRLPTYHPNAAMKRLTTQFGYVPEDIAPHYSAAIACGRYFTRLPKGCQNLWFWIHFISFSRIVLLVLKY